MESRPSAPSALPIELFPRQAHLGEGAHDPFDEAVATDHEALHEAAAQDPGDPARSAILASAVRPITLSNPALSW
jgi:hypothetical protein